MREKYTLATVFMEREPRIEINFGKWPLITRLVAAPMLAFTVAWGGYFNIKDPTIVKEFKR